MGVTGRTVRNWEQTGAMHGRNAARLVAALAPTPRDGMATNSQRYLEHTVMMANEMMANHVDPPQVTEVSISGTVNETAVVISASGVLTVPQLLDLAQQLINAVRGS